MQGYLSISDASKMLQISETTLYKLRRDGIGPPYFLVRAAIRYRTVDIYTWAKNNLRRFERARKSLLTSKQNNPLFGAF